MATRKKCIKCGKTPPEVKFRVIHRCGTERGECSTCEQVSRNARRAKVPKKPDRQAPGVKTATPLPRPPTYVLSELALRNRVSTLSHEISSLSTELHNARQRETILGRMAADQELNYPIIAALDKKNGKREATAVLLCSDWHIEEPVLPEKVNGLNEYNLDIAKQRVEKLVEGAVWLCRMHSSHYDIRNFVLWLGGDLFSGYIHEELTETALLSPVECILELRALLTMVIDSLLKNLPGVSLTIPCCFGNHGRTGQRIRISTGAENSYEWLLYRFLGSQYADNKRVTVHAPRSQITYTDVYDFKLRFIHGNQVKYGGGVGGVTIPLNKKIDSWDRGIEADLTCLGHFHQYLPGRKSIVNGSLIGFAPYADFIGARFEPPQQSFFLVDRYHGPRALTAVRVEDDEHEG